MEYGSPAPFVACVLAISAGVLIAVAEYAIGAFLAVMAVLVYGLWTYAMRRGDDDRHTLW
jgi:hypothetical protein